MQLYVTTPTTVDICSCSLHHADMLMAC